MTNYRDKGWDFKDETFAVVDSFSVQGEDYALDTHELMLLPNGYNANFSTESRVTPTIGVFALH